MSESEPETSNLEFQNFDLSDTQNYPTQPLPSNDISLDTAPLRWWNITFYSKYFDVNSKDVQNRLTASLLPQSDFLSLIGDNPDLYGPFWISTFSIFVVFFSESIVALLESTKVDYTKFASIAALGYSYAFTIPLILWTILKFMSSDLKLMPLFCIYGYSQTVIVPLSLLMLLRVSLLKWLFVIVAGLISGSFLFSNVWCLLSGTHLGDKKMPIVFGAGIIHALYYLVLKLVFLG